MPIPPGGEHHRCGDGATVHRGEGLVSLWYVPGLTAGPLS